MKIIVRSKAEKTLIEKFLELMHSEDLDILTSDVCLDEYKLNSTDLVFLENGMLCAKIEVDNSVEAMEHDDSIIYGYCSKCDEPTCGTIDGSNVSYEEYLDYLDESKDWLCESCFQEREE